MDNERVHTRYHDQMASYAVAQNHAGSVCIL